MDSNLINRVRAGVMPFVTISGWCAIIYGVFIAEVSIPDWFQVAVVGNTAWWFATTRGDGAKPPVP